MKLFLLIFFVASCTSRSKINQKSDYGNCEDAVVELQRGAIARKILDPTKEITGSLFSYNSRGLDSTTHVVVVTSEYSILKIDVCGSASGSEDLVKKSGLGDACAQLIAVSTSDISGSKLRKNHPESSASKCADLSPLSQQLRKIAGCFAGRNNQKDLKIAIAELENIKSDKRFVSCISEEEKTLLVEQLFQYQNKLQKI